MKLGQSIDITWSEKAKRRSPRNRWKISAQLGKIGQIRRPLKPESAWYEHSWIIIFLFRKWKQIKIVAEQYLSHKKVRRSQKHV